MWEHAIFVFLWFISLSIIPSKSIHVVANGRISFFSYGWVIFHCIYYCCLVTQSCLTLCDPTDCSMPAFPVHYQLLELTQTHAHLVGDTIQPSHPLLSPSPPTFNLSQHQGLFQCIGSSHQVAKVFGASVSASILPTNIQDLFSLGLTGLISL